MACAIADSGVGLRCSRHSGTQQRPSHMNTRSAFTLLETLVALAILVVLAALIGTGLSSARERSAIAQSSQNLRQLGLLTQQYVAENNGFLPVRDFTPIRYNWLTALHPLAYDEPFPNFLPSSTGVNLKNTIFYSPVMKPDEGAPLRSYGINTYLAADPLSVGTLPDNRIRIIALARPSATLLYADARNKSDLRPGALNAVGTLQFRNNGRALICFVDGHVESRLPEEIPTNRLDVFWSGK